MKSPSPSIPHFLRRLACYLKPHLRLTIVLLLALILDTVLQTVQPLGFKFLIDYAILPHDRFWLVATVVGFGVIVLLAALNAVGRDYLYARLSTALLSDLRLLLFGHLQRLSLGFYTKASKGELLARFATDLAAVENAIVLALPAAIMSALGILLTGGALFFLEWRLALLTFVGVPLCVLGPWLLGQRAAEAGLAYKEQQAALGTSVEEGISAQAVVKSFSLQGLLIQRFQEQVDRLAAIGIRASMLSYLLERTPNLGILVFQWLVLALGSLLVFQDTLGLGALVAFHALAVTLSQSVYGLTWSVPHLLQAAIGLQRIEELLQEPALVTDATGAAALQPFQEALTFDDVSFGYTSEQLNLREVSLSIPRGSSVAFVGPSGCGKSTVLNLILRFYDPVFGTVSCDGMDLRKIAQDSLRRQIGVVLQESFLFNTTVRENIRLGWQEATDAEIEAAARAAEIHDLVLQFPQGYDTIVGERGGRLSGGQRQRIALARALIRNPDILVLDEATSALDPCSEAAISATLKQVANGRTRIAVTHRLAGVVDADRIFVLQAGRLVEQGKHDELLALNGIYRSLWEKQSGFVVSANGDEAGITAERLRQFPILQKLDPPLLASVASLLATEHFPEERVVVQEGDVGDRFYIIVRGSVVVFNRGADGRENPLAALQDGDYFGEVALLRSVPRTASVRTRTPCVFLTLPREPFANLLRQAPGLREILEQSYPRRVQEQVAVPAEVR